MAILYVVMPLIEDDEFMRYLHKHGITPPVEIGSRYPTLREIVGALEQLEGYTFEGDLVDWKTTKNTSWQADIFEQDRAADRLAGEWAHLCVGDYQGNDDMPLRSLYFRKGDARLTVLIVQQLTHFCGSLVVMLDTCFIPILVTPETDIDQAIQAWN